MLSPIAGMVPVYVASAVGLGAGSVVLALMGYWSVDARIWPLSLLRDYGEQLQRSYVGQKLQGGRKNLLYFTCQAIPFFPMRSSTIVYAGLFSKTRFCLLLIFLIAALGTLVRMFLVFFFDIDLVPATGAQGYGP